jgi:hypothetical protein
MRSAAPRVGIVVLFALAALSCFAPRFLVLAGLYAPLNVRFHPASTTVAAVVKGSEAERSGLAVGDTIDPDAYTAAVRYRLSQNPILPVGSTLILSVRARNGHSKIISLRVVPYYVPLELATVWIVLALWGLVVISLGTVFAIVRPSTITYAFFAATLAEAIGASDNPLVVFLFGVGWLPFIDAIQTSIVALGYMGLVTICVRFPGERPPPLRRVLEVLGWTTCVALNAVYFFYLLHRTRGLYEFYAASAWMLVAVVVAAFIARFVSADGGLKQRLRWVGVGLLTVVIGRAIFFFDRSFVVSEQLETFAIVSNVLPFTFAYALVRERVIDVRFLSARTVVYAALTSMPFILFRASDWLLRTELQRSTLALALEVVVAVACGFFINAMQSRLDRFVEQLIFAARYRSERGVRSLLATLPSESHRERIGPSIVQTCSEAMDLASIAIFLRAGGTFQRAATAGLLSGEDGYRADGELPSRLRAAGTLLRLDDAIAFPFNVRCQLAGFLFVGRHRNGESLDPVEERLLSQVSIATGVAYDTLYVESLLAELELLRESSLDRQWIATPTLPE